MNTRIYLIRTNLKLSQKEFAEKIGLSPSTLCELENGKSTITERTILLICSTYNVNQEWLKTGNGDMFIKEDIKFNEFFSIYKDISPVLQDFLLDTAKKLLDIQDKI